MADIIDEFNRWRRQLLRIDLPMEPDRISALSVVASLGVWIAPLPALAVVVLLDLLDGAVARARKKYGSESGKIVDVACDRYSEFLIFGHYAARYPLLAVLPILNTAMALLGASRRGKYVPIFPLRQGLLLYLVLLQLGLLP